MIHFNKTSALSYWAEFQDLQWHLGYKIQILLQLSYKQLLLNYSFRSHHNPSPERFSLNVHCWTVGLPSTVPWTIAICPLRGFNKIPGCYLVSCLFITQAIWCSRILPPMIQYQESYLVSTYVLSLSSVKPQEQFCDTGFSKEIINNLFITY